MISNNKTIPSLLNFLVSPFLYQNETCPDICGFVVAVQLLSYVWLCNPMDCSTPGFPVLCLPEFAQTHVHRVGDAIQPCHLLSSPSPPAFRICGEMKYISETELVCLENSLLFPKERVSSKFLTLVHERCSPVWLSATPSTVVHQAPLSVGFPRHEYWSG